MTHYRDRLNAGHYAPASAPKDTTTEAEQPKPDKPTAAPVVRPPRQRRF